MLAIEGRIPMDRMRAAIVTFDAERQAPKGDMAWVGWLDAIAHLGFADVAAGIGAVWIDQRLPPEVIARKRFRQSALAAAIRAL